LGGFLEWHAERERGRAHVLVTSKQVRHVLVLHLSSFILRGLLIVRKRSRSIIVGHNRSLFFLVYAPQHFISKNQKD
jgi:hypothetical protein